jgi:hypothetical protein
MWTTKGAPVTTRRLYLELTALLIEREIAKFTNGEQAAPESFAHVAKLAATPKKRSRPLARERFAVAPRTCVSATDEARVPVGRSEL